MGEHPSPGPAVAASAEAERIEELEPEAEEQPPVAPEDVSAPPPPGQTFWGALRGELSPSRPREATCRVQGDAGAPRIVRVPAGGRGRRDQAPPKARTPSPTSGSHGFPAGPNPHRRAGAQSVAGAASPRLVQCPGHGVFPQRRPRHNTDSIPSPPLATCGLPKPGKERAPQGPRNAAALTGQAAPFFPPGLSPAGHLPCRDTH